MKEWRNECVPLPCWCWAPVGAGIPVSSAWETLRKLAIVLVWQVWGKMGRLALGKEGGRNKDHKNLREGSWKADSGCFSSSAGRHPGSQDCITSPSKAQSGELRGEEVMGHIGDTLSSCWSSWSCRRCIWGRHCSPGSTEPHSWGCQITCLKGTRAQVLPENSATPKLHLRASPLHLMNFLRSHMLWGADSTGISPLCPCVHEKCSFALSLPPLFWLWKSKITVIFFLILRSTFKCQANERKSEHRMTQGAVCFT